MEIKEKDFKIVFLENSYVLYVLKNKKEKKEDSESEFKISGYYTSFLCLILKIIEFRSSKKYPGKESSEDIINLSKMFNEIHLNLIKCLKLKDEPIYKLIENVTKDKNLL